MASNPAASHVAMASQLSKAGVASSSLLTSKRQQFLVDPPKISVSIWAGSMQLGFERAASTVPIAPGNPPTDAQLFEHATDAAVRYWLPRYRLRQSQGRYEIAMAPGDDGLWSLRFGLEAVPAPELAGTAATAQLLPHERSYVVRHAGASSSIVLQHTPAEVSDEPAGPVLTLRLTLEERDALLRAFRSDTARAEIIVTRRAEVAVPLPASSLPTGPAAPVKPLPSKRLQVAALRSKAESATLRVRAAPAGALAGNLTASLRVDAVAARPIVRDHRTVPVIRDHRTSPVIRDHRTRPTVTRPPIVRPPSRPPPIRPPRPVPAPVPTPAAPTPAGPPRYLKQSAALDHAIPLRFDQAEHPYLFPESMGSGPATSVERIVLGYPTDDPGARKHAYFRDLARANRFYYLPDDFRLARTADPPFVPALVLRVDQAEDEAATQLEMTFALQPHVDPRRLAAAATALQAHVTVQGSEPPALPQLQPLLAPASLRLSLPRDGVVKTVDVDADIDLCNGAFVTERFPMSELQDVFAVLMGSGLATLLRGSVSVDTGLAAAELVPVQVSLSNTEGQLFLMHEATDPAGGIAVTLRNATESPLRIAALPAWIQRGATLVEARLEGLDLSAPVDLAADTALKFKLLPMQPLETAEGGQAGEGAEPLEAVLDTSAVTLLPDKEALLPLILDESIDQETERTVMVRSTADLLAGSGPETAVSLVIVEFRGNVNVTLDASNLQQQVAVPVPLLDILLSRDTEGVYRYRQTVVFQQGGRTQTGEWRDSDLGVLVVPQA